MNQIKHIDYTSEALGFDLRLHDHIAVELPAGDPIQVSFNRDNGAAGDDRVTLRTSPTSVKRAMEQAGYSVTLAGEVRG